MMTTSESTFSEIAQPDWEKLPSKQGLYDPNLEKDSCGVGVIMDIEGKPCRKIMDDAREMLCRMSHRGGLMSDPRDGDGAGILIGIPDSYYRQLSSSFLPEGSVLPPSGEYGMGNVFLPQEENRRLDCTARLARLAERFGLRVLGWRWPLDVQSEILGPASKGSEPFIAQVFVGRIDANEVIKDDGSETEGRILTEEEDKYLSSTSRVGGVSAMKRSKLKPNSNRTGKRYEGERRPPKPFRTRGALSPEICQQLPLEYLLYLLRKAAGSREKTEMFICSLSSKTVTYKGQLTCAQLFVYYNDLSDPQLTTHLAMVHSRFSTNTFPSWSRSQPFRRLCHNGEINTLSGNKQALKSREGGLTGLLQPILPSGMSESQKSVIRRILTPADEGIGSDSATVDNLFEQLNIICGWPLPMAMMLLVREAWRGNVTMSDDKKAMYRYLSCLSEPWDGPAMLAFTDGDVLGATLDRNGLRPSRFMITKGGLFVLSSEVGVVDVDSSDVLQKGRLGPGRMILVDTKQGRVVQDEEIKKTLSASAPFVDFLKQAIFIDAESTKKVAHDDNMFSTEKSKGIPITLDVLDVPEATLTEQLVMHGYFSELVDMVLSPMARVAQEPLGSMGHDAPLACLSRLPLSSFYYMQQLFAEATNPAIDPLRESIVMSLECPIGPQLVGCTDGCGAADFGRPHALACGSEPARRVVLDEPILCPWRYQQLLDLEADTDSGIFPFSVVDTTYRIEAARDIKRSAALRDFSGACALESRLHDICEEAEAAVRDGAGVLILCDRRAGPSRVPVDALLAVGAVHHHLIKCRLRSQTAIIAEAASVSSIHQMCCLLGFGADAIYPYLAYAALTKVRPTNSGIGKESARTELSLNKMVKNYRAATHAGILKVMSKMGISCLSSYKGAQLFQCIGLAVGVKNLCFVDCMSSLGGVGFRSLQEDALRLHTNAYPSRPLPPLVDTETSRAVLPEMGLYHFRSVGNNSELHMNAPDVIAKIQESARKDSPAAYKEYEEWENALVDECELRGLLEICYDKCKPIAIEKVETESDIVKRFCTGAVSFGAISAPTHEALAEAMNSLGGRSNTGEGGEDESRFGQDSDTRSRIKQVASGRFGVTAAYLADADEIQIKLAQGAKPGEGGELPGYKVVGAIAEIRKSTPGVGLISPPPHHDMYSIEDVAQLVSDLKHTNPSARISLKLVSKIGVGIIAAGLVKGGAGHVVISGNSGGTGAAKWTSIKHAGGPWELGVAESHQVLVLNGLRDRVTLQADGQIRTARDVVYAGLLGSDEIAMTTVPMIALGCVMMRKCHLNICPVGIATQDPELVKKFAGQPDDLVNFLWLMAGEVRRIMAKLGIRRFQDLIGRTDLLRMKSVVRENMKTAEIDLSAMLKPTWDPRRRSNARRGLRDDTSVTESTMTGLSEAAFAEELDQRILARARPMIEGDEKDLTVEIKEPIQINNSDRTVGARVSYEIAKHRGSVGLPEGSLFVAFSGSAGQSFGSWLMRGVTFSLEGEANDYVGKGLCGGDIDIRPAKPCAPEFRPEDNVIIGNACLYGATGGRLFVNGQAGDRFAVRNSGGVAVVEGCGDHGCEYMTRGVVVVLGTTGRNFAAGMSGGLAYVLDLDKTCCNKQTVYLDPLGGDAREDKIALKALLAEHLKRTGSPKAAELLADWANSINRFTKVFPHEYKRVLKEAIVEHVKTGSTVAASILNDFENMRRSCVSTKTSAKSIIARYNLWRSTVDGREDHTLEALGLGDVPKENVGDLIQSVASGRGMARAFRMGYRMWRQGHYKGSKDVLHGLDLDHFLSERFPKQWERFTEGLKKNPGAGDPLTPAVRLIAKNRAAAGGGDSTNHSRRPSGEYLDAHGRPRSRGSSFDIEDMAVRGTDSRPASVAFPDKRAGFKLYSRRNPNISRDPKSRVLDWEEIYSKKPHRSRLYDQLLTTQAARCMDCGTPSCHYPNTGGGGCPLGNRIPTFNQLVYEGQWKLALDRLLDTNNFPEFTGTACPAPCEEACVLAINEPAVTIKSVELAIIEHAFQKGWIKPMPPLTKTYKTVAIVGSGPTGLAAAAQLNKAGHSVTVFERADRIGGLLVYGIPNMKLDKIDKVQRRVDILQQEGIEFKTDIEIGSEPYTLSSLRSGYDAVLLATGATQSRDALAKIPGRDLKGIYQAMDFLTLSQKSWLDSELDDDKFIDCAGRKVIVIGGGDTAVDCVATAIRLGAESVLQFSRRPAGTKAVSRWPYWDEDVYRVEYAHEEADAIHSRDPREYEVQSRTFVGEDGVLKGIQTVRVSFDPVSRTTKQVEDSEHTYPCDLCLLAMGFTGPDEILDRGQLPRKDGCFDADYGTYTVKVDGETSVAPEAPVFAAGDCRRGASLIVTALAEGRDVAAVIDSYLTSATHEGFSSVLPRCVPLSANPALYRGPNWSRMESIHSTKPLNIRQPISSLRRAGSISK